MRRAATNSEIRSHAQWTIEWMLERLSSVAVVESEFRGEIERCAHNEIERLLLLADEMA